MWKEFHQVGSPQIPVNIRFHSQKFSILNQKKFHIDREHQFLDQTEEKKEEGLRGE